MQVVHITKHPYNRATRTKMQASWTQNAVILTPMLSENPTKFKCSPLSVSELLKKIYDRPAAIVFHEQGTLNYLFISLIFKFLLRASGVKIIYDIHDIYEYQSVAQQLLRPTELIKRFLEWSVFKIRTIRIITVSNGLADYYKQKHGRRPDVVRSISMFDTRVPNPGRNGLIYFGAGLARFPFELLSMLLSQPVYYFGTKDSIDENSRNMRYMGSYSSSDLSFLSDHLALVVSANSGLNQDNSQNIKFSLPNKFFQSLSHFLPIVIRGDFVEAEEYFKSIDGFIYKWDGTEGHLTAIMERISVRNFGMAEADRKMVAKFVSNGFECERSSYFRAISV